MKKLQPCCARKEGEVIRSKALLARAARMASREIRRNGRISERTKVEMSKARDHVASAQENLEDHEAAHASDLDYAHRSNVSLA